MIPSIDILTNEIAEKERPSKTYKINVEADRIDGNVNGLDSIAQAVYLILSSERYAHIIYSWDYGIELVDLFGKPMPYVMSELPRRIKEALTQDDRINDVVDFTFESNRNNLLTKFTVITNAGNLSSELEVTI
jgi:hypothetical protein